MEETTDKDADEELSSKSKVHSPVCRPDMLNFVKSYGMLTNDTPAVDSRMLIASKSLTFDKSSFESPFTDKSISSMEDKLGTTVFAPANVISS